MEEAGTLSLQKSSRLQEGIIMLFLATIAISAAYAYVNDISFLRDDRIAHSEDGLADTIEILNTVRLKKSGVVFWSSASPQQSLIRGDQLFTDNNSEVEIRFKDGSTVRIAENSLIRLDRQDQESGIDLLQGQVLQADIKSENKKFSLKIGDLEVKLSHGSRFQAKSDQGSKPQLLLESGNAAIIRDSKEAKIIKSETSEIEAHTSEEIKADITTASVMPLTKNGLKFHGFDQTTVALDWQADSQIREFQIETSPSNTFVPSTIKVVRGHKTELALTQAGTYYWRVRPKLLDGSWGQASMAQTVSFLKLPQIEVHWPPASYIHKLERDPDTNQALVFSWTYSPVDHSNSALQTEWELSRDPHFSGKTTKKLTDKKQFRADLKPGKYYWRLRSQLSNGQVGPWLATREIIVEYAPEAPGVASIPADPNPVDSATGHSTLANSEAIPEIGQTAELTHVADPIPEPLSSSKANPKELLQAPVVAKTETTAKLKDFEMQLPAKNAPIEIAKKSSSLDQAKLAARAPQLQKQVAPPDIPILGLSLSGQKTDLGKGVPLQISLKKVNGAKSFDIEISDQSNFNRSLHVMNTSDRQLTKVLRGGNYFVRARAVSSAGTSDWSKTQTIQIPSWKALPGPSISVAKPATIYRQKPESLKLAFNLPEDNIKNFEIEMANTTEFPEGSSHKFTSTTGSISLTPRFAENYLRVRAIDSYGKAGEWSSVGLFTATKTDELPQLITPSDKSRIQFSYLDKKNVEFRWTKAPDIDQQSIKIAKDPKFEEIIVEEKVEEPRFLAELNKDLKYYWQVKQTNSREKLDIESSVYSFQSTTLPVPPVDRMMFPQEIYVGYGFSMLDYKFETAGSSSEIGGSYANSLFLNYNYWFSDTFSFELDLIGHIISLTSLSEDNVERDYTISFMDVSMLSRALWQLSREKGFYLEGLLGASTNSVPKIIALEDGSLSTKSYRPVHAWGGFGLLYALSQTVYFNSRIEGGIPFQSANLKNGIYLKGTIRALQRLPRWNANLAYGLLGEYKKYTFDNNGADETLTHVLKGFQLGLGKDF